MAELGSLGASIDKVLAERDELVRALVGVAESDAQDDDHPCWCASSGLHRPGQHTGYCKAARAAVAKVGVRS